MSAEPDEPNPAELPSRYLCRFRLFPAHLCRNLCFRVSASDFVAFCTRDLLTIEVLAVPGDVRPLLLRADAHASMLLDAATYYRPDNRQALDLTPEGWVEVKNADAAPVTVGYSDRSLEDDPISADHPDNTPFTRAQVELLPLLESTAGLAAALADFRIARRGPAIYQPFYAHRVLEDVACSIAEKDDPKDAWGPMNRALGTSEETWAPLTEASKAVRHQGPLAGAPRPHVHQLALFRLAREAVDRWIGLLRQSQGSS
jgi:hypothetical protein